MKTIKPVITAVFASLIIIGLIQCNSDSSSGGSATSSTSSSSTSSTSGNSSQVPTPVITPSDSGPWYLNILKMQITCDTTGAEIYFTNDGTVPSKTNGTRVEAGTNIWAFPDSRHYIWAIAYKDGMTDSEIAKADYNFGPNVGAQLRLENSSAGGVTWTSLRLRSAGTTTWGPNQFSAGYGECVPGNTVVLSQIGAGNYDVELTKSDSSIVVKSNVPVIASGVTTINLP